MIITIDGTAGSGKSTISKQLADMVHCQYLNSGAFYRTLTYIGLYFNDIQSDGIVANRHSYYLNVIIPNIQYDKETIRIETGDNSFVLHDELFTIEIDKYVAQVSQEVTLRRAINMRIRDICAIESWIVEGRDAGTQIFPEADVKFYLDANLEVRALRRQQQYEHDKSSANDNLTQISNMLSKRDTIDKNKGEYSLKKIEQAIYIDTSFYSIEQVLKTTYNIVKSIQ